MSANLTLAPAFIIAATVGIAVFDTVITSSFLPILRHLSAIYNASVPFATPIQI